MSTPSSLCSFEADASFGPIVPSCRRPFDFTLFFEEIVFIAIPSGLFILIAIARLFVIFRRSTTRSRDQPELCDKSRHQIRYGVAYFVKLFTAALLVGLHVAMLVLICTIEPRHLITTASIPSAVVATGAAVLLAALYHFEHTRLAKPSLLIGFYLCATALLRSANVRTHALLYGSDIELVPVEITLILTQIVFVALEELPRSLSSPLSFEPDRSCQIVSTEELSGFLNRSGCAWLLRLLFRGYKKALGPSELDQIDSSLSSSLLSEQFKHILPAVPTGSPEPNGRYTLLLAVLRALGFYFLAPVVPRLFLTGFTFAQPFLASATIDYIGDTSASRNAGYGLIGAACLVYGGIAVSTSWYWNLAYKSVTKIRGGLIDGVSRKMLRLGKKQETESKVLTMMISDVHRITTSMAYMHEIWVAPFETAIGTWLLCRQVGPSGLVVLAIIAICTAASTWVGKHMATQQGVWLAANEKRIGATKKMLSSIKAIKMMGVGPKVSAALDNLRSLEFSASRMFRMLIVGSLISSYSTLTLSPLLVFGTYIGAEGSTGANFDASTLFSSLILISLLAAPLIQLLQIIPSFGAALGSLERMHAFFQREELSDTREFAPESSAASYNSGKDAPETRIAVSISGGYFGFTEDRAVLQDINLKATIGQHVVITGPVGCGKSLLLQAILGEVPSTQNGRVIVTGKVAFCSQEPWLENISAEETISRFGKSDDDRWRQRVVKACALDEFLESQIPDATIGSQGLKISGGERQRLALARAIESQPDILLLDDVFSPIDHGTKRRMLTNLFGARGILRETSTTVINITHDYVVSQMADVVLRVGETGRLEPYQFPEQTDDTKEDADGEQSDPDELHVDASKEIASVSMRNLHEKKLTPRKPEATPVKISDRQVYRIYFKSIGQMNVVLFIAGGIVFAFCLKFPDVWVRWWSADSDLSTPTHNVAYWFGLYAALNILPLIAVSAWVGHLMIRIVPTSGRDLHRKLLETVFRSTFPFISAVDTGSLINRFNQDLMFVDTKLPLDLLNTVAALFTCVAQVILVGISAVYVLASLPIVALTLFAIQHFYLRTSKQLRHLDLHSKGDLHTKLSESFQGLATIRAHRWQSQLQFEFQEKLNRSQQPVYLLWMVQTWLKLVLNMVVAGLAVVVMGVAVALRRNESLTSSSAIGIAFLNLTTLGETLTNLLASWTSLETSLGAISRIESFSKDTPTETERGTTQEVPLPATWPGVGDIVLENVWATYNKTPDDHEKIKWSLQDVSLNVRGGERLAICGRSGSGKSTLLLALLRLIEMPRGSIRIDGCDISSMSLQRLRSSLHVISQDAFISAASGETVRQFLDPDGRVGDEATTKILKDCGIMEKISSIGGISSVLDENVQLSVGESQLLALARVVSQAASMEHGILLLDEATSSLDSDTEDKIAKVIKQRLPKMTVVSVLHRLETAMRYDRIVVLEKGRVDHIGTPSEVMGSAEIFSSLSKQQS